MFLNLFFMFLYYFLSCIIVSFQFYICVCIFPYMLLVFAFFSLCFLIFCCSSILWNRVDEGPSDEGPRAHKWIPQTCGKKCWPYRNLQDILNMQVICMNWYSGILALEIIQYIHRHTHLVSFHDVSPHISWMTFFFNTNWTTSRASPRNSMFPRTLPPWNPSASGTTSVFAGHPWPPCNLPIFECRSHVTSCNMMFLLYSQ